MASVGLAANAAGPDGRPLCTTCRASPWCCQAASWCARAAAGTPSSSLSPPAAAASSARSIASRWISSICAALDEGGRRRGSRRAARRLRTARAAVFVPPHEVQKFLEDAQALCHEWRMELAGVRLRRTRIEEDTLLRWARREYAALSLTLAAPADALGAEVRATQLRRALIAAIARAGSFPVHA